MRILVTGANGQLGRSLRIAAAASRDEYLFADINEVEGLATFRLDITDIAAVREFVARHGIECTVNCAAYTDVNAAESDRAAAELLNAEAPRNLATAMRETGGCLIHISTDYVFGTRRKTPYTERCKTAPKNVYGATKLQGEQNIKATGGKYLIIRTSWMYSEFGRNFLKTILQLTRSRSEIKVVDDQRGTPTFARDLATAIVKIIDGRNFRRGIYHYSGEGECSWFEFATAIAESAGHDGCKILPCRSDEYPSPVERPEYSTLDKSKIRRTFGVDVPEWRESLKECMKTVKKQQA